MIQNPLSAKMALLVLLLAPSAFAVLTPEQEALRLSRVLKPIPDEEWKSIAGDKAESRYDVTQGDTLYDISKRLFGDARYWPKIWALNNDRITNPHIIRPGYQVAFLPGTGTSLPGVSVQTSEGPGAPGPRAEEVPAEIREDWGSVPKGLAEQLRDEPRSREWTKLPRQSWEHAPLPTTSDVDAQGFDRKNRVQIKVSTGFELEAFAASEKIEPLGRISGSRTESLNLVTGDAVFIVADSELQIGATYGVTSNPLVLKSRKSTRTGYSYSIEGEVKIIGVKEGLFIGTITKTKYFLNRGAYLMNVVPRVSTLKPIAGPSPLEGVVMFDRRFGTYAAAQGKSVFIDRGTDDGVQPGMVFRAYQYHDPVSDKRMTDSDFIINADIMVTYASPQFCVGTVIRNFSPVTENSMVVLLTDVSDLNNLSGFRNRSTEEIQRDKELDDLDRLDGRPLTDEERRELEQLENWKQNPPGSEAAPADPNAPPGEPAVSADPLDPSTAPPPAPEDEALAPPPPPEGADPLDPGAAPPAEMAPPPADAVDGSVPPPPPGDVMGDPAATAPPPPPADGGDALDPSMLPSPAPEGELAPPPPPPVE
jgi:hypothetical protein